MGGKPCVSPAIALAGLGLLVAGCPAVGPDYVEPKTPVPAGFGEAARPLGQASEAPFIDAAWWRSFGDSTLNGLVAEALKSAPDLAEAQARVREARALQGIAGAGRYPTADASGEYTRNLGSDNVPTGVPPGGLGPGIHSNLWQAGFDASWEIDLFGGVRRTVEAAGAHYQAVAEDRADVTLTLLAEVARDYIDLRGAQRRIEVAQKNLAIERDLLALTQSLLTAGLAPQQDLLRAEAQVRDIQAAIPEFETDERSAAYRIAALIGRPLAEVSLELSEPRPIPQSLSDVPLGLPSDLLKRRPDVRAAERRIAAANARIGVAQADLYPHFSLTGGAGLESLYFSSFGNASSGYYQIGPGVTWRIFDAGKIRFEVQAESARTAAAQATDIAKLLYERGVESFLPVLDAERSLYAADDALAQSERDSALALVALYKSLGGGWVSASAEMSIGK